VTVDENTDVADDDPTADDTAEAAETAERKDPAARPRDGVAWRVMRSARRRVGVIVVTVALIASAGVAAWLYFDQYRPDTQTDAAAANVALEAAKTGTIALLSYSPESLDQDFATAKSHLTGDFLSYYTQFTEQIVTPAAKEKSVKTTASVVRAAVSEIQPDSAVVLVFINQNTTSKENPDGAFAASSVKVGLKKVDDTWLISAFDPV